MHDDAWRWLAREADEPELREVAAAAFEEPELRRLFPFGSVGRLRVSRTATYPTDLPFIVHVDAGIYEVRGSTGLLGAGSAREAARLLADAVSEVAAPTLRDPEDVEPPR